MSPTLAILLVGSAVAASCALIGTFLVLRKMALLGDAISHAVLPGIAVAFLITGDRSALPMVLGASVLGVVTVFLVELGTRSGRLREDASIGVVFPALFSIGVILISRYAGQVDIDLDCVLYGEIAYTPWDVFFWGERSMGPRALWINGIILGLVVIFVAIFYTELKLSTFDASLSAALGFSPVVLHYLLMSMLSITVVGAFESVGAILVVAMLVVPPATAYLLTERLSRMLGLSVLFGVASAVLGYYAARLLDASIAGAMASMAGALFGLVLLLSPTHGLLAKVLRHRSLSEGMSEQLLMLHIGHVRASSLDVVRRRFSWREAKLRRIVSRLRRRGWLEADHSGHSATKCWSGAWPDRSRAAEPSAVKRRSPPGSASRP
ncbi:MAG: metal ABC transporter permease, partial [Acidobacteriota bacterium]